MPMNLNDFNMKVATGSTLVSDHDVSVILGQSPSNVSAYCIHPYCIIPIWE